MRKHLLKNLNGKLNVSCSENPKVLVINFILQNKRTVIPILALNLDLKSGQKMKLYSPRINKSCKFTWNEKQSLRSFMNLLQKRKDQENIWIFHVKWALTNGKIDKSFHVLYTYLHSLVHDFNHGIRSSHQTSSYSKMNNFGF